MCRVVVVGGGRSDGTPDAAIFIGGLEHITVRPSKINQEGKSSPHSSSAEVTVISIEEVQSNVSLAGR